MKKIISILIVALVALAFMGCPTTYSTDLDLYNNHMDLDLNADGIAPAGVTIIKGTGTADKNLGCLYTLEITNLQGSIGEKFVLAGASIISKKTVEADSSRVPGDYWNVTEADVTKANDLNLVQTVDETGKLTFEFYGKNPGWFGKDSPAFKVCVYDDSSWDAILATSGQNFGIDKSASLDSCKVSIDLFGLK